MPISRRYKSVPCLALRSLNSLSQGRTRSWRGLGGHKRASSSHFLTLNPNDGARRQNLATAGREAAAGTCPAWSAAVPRTAAGWHPGPPVAGRARKTPAQTVQKCDAGGHLPQRLTVPLLPVFLFTQARPSPSWRAISDVHRWVSLESFGDLHGVGWTSGLQGHVSQSLLSSPLTWP